MSRSGLLLFGLVTALGTAAHADEAVEMTGKDVRAVGGGYQLYFGGDQLRVRKGKRSAPLLVADGAPRATHILGVKTAGKAVTLSYMPSCTDVEETYSHDQLAARLELEEGVRLAGKGKHAAAEKLLAHAVTLDPSWERAVRSEARVLVKLGRADDAVAILASRLAANPMGEYFRVAQDPELSSLLEHTALAKLRAPAGAVPVAAKIDETSWTLPASGIARAPGGQLAFVESIGSHGACWQTTSLVIRDGKSLSVLGSASLTAPADYNGDGCDEKNAISAAGKAQIRARVAAANQLLAALGFAPLDGEQMTENSEVRPGVRTLRFGKSGQGLVVGADGAARLFQGGKLVVEHPAGTLDASHVTQAMLVPSEQRIFLATWSSGCEHAESSDIEAVSTK